jgi:hypothetical protein
MMMITSIAEQHLVRLNNRSAAKGTEIHASSSAGLSALCLVGLMSHVVELSRAEQGCSMCGQPLTGSRGIRLFKKLLLSICYSDRSYRYTVQEFDLYGYDDVVLSVTSTTQRVNERKFIIMLY